MVESPSLSEGGVSGARLRLRLDMEGGVEVTEVMGVERTDRTCWTLDTASA